jgi:excisionase family DNA binding protein
MDTEISRLLRINEVAELLCVHPTTLRRWDKEGRLKSVRIGSRRGLGDRRYRLEDVQKFIAKSDL